MANFWNSILIPIVLVIGPVIGYIPQYREIQKTGNPHVFSPLVILILLVANILRIFFWVEKRFEVALLLQSVLMIVAQLLLLELMVRLRSGALESTNEHYTLFGHDLGEFWAWSEINRYIGFLSTLTLVIGGVSFLNILVLKSPIYTEIVGTFALLIEATLAMPQFYQNYQNKSTRGLRPELVAAWALGDAGKTILFIARKAPVQFLVCGMVQLAVDFAIFYQMRIYRESSASLDPERGFTQEDVLATSQAGSSLGEPKLPPKSLTKSLDNFFFELTPAPTPMKRAQSVRSRPNSPFFRD